MNAIAAKIPHKWREVITVSVVVVADGLYCAEQVGSALGLSDGELQGIDMQNKAENLIECFRDLIVKWRSKADDDHPYRLSTILAALQSTQVEEKEVAKDYHHTLQKVHKLNGEHIEGNYPCTQVRD